MKKVEELLKDCITGLPNLIELDKEIKKNNSFKTFFMIDILFFSDINENYGYYEGNKILKFFSIELKKILNEYFNNNKLIEYSVYRIYSDKFGILFNEELSYENIKILSNFLIKKFMKIKYHIDNNEFNIEITIGISSGIINSLMKKSEENLYTAKKMNLKFYYKKNILNDNNDFNNLILLKIINDAIEKDYIFPMYQKIINNKTGKILKYEALMRINYYNYDNKEIILSPGIFINFSKRARIYSKLMKIMFLKVFNDVEKYKINVSINLSFEDIINEDLIYLIKSNLELKQIGKFITFEIVESEQINDNIEIKNFFDMIKNFKCKISIDDFGSGYSNYDQLLKLNANYLKIDGSLINKYKNKEHISMLKSIQYYCSENNIETIAEFVDTKEKYEEIKKIGINYSQGFYFSKPQKIENLNLKI